MSLPIYLKCHFTSHRSKCHLIYSILLFFVSHSSSSCLFAFTVSDLTFYYRPLSSLQLQFIYLVGEFASNFRWMHKINSNKPNEIGAVIGSRSQNGFLIVCVCLFSSLRFLLLWKQDKYAIFLDVLSGSCSHLRNRNKFYLFLQCTEIHQNKNKKVTEQLYCERRNICPPYIINEVSVYQKLTEIHQNIHNLFVKSLNDSCDFACIASECALAPKMTVFRLRCVIFAIINNE